MKQGLMFAAVALLAATVGCLPQLTSPSSFSPSGEPALTLDFAHPRGDMCTPDSESYGDFYCQGGEMNLVNAGHTGGYAGIYFSPPGVSDLKNFMLQATMHSVGEAGSYGLQFRTSTGEQGYVFLVRPAGAFHLMLFEKVEGKWDSVELLPWKPSGAIHKGEAVNLLQVIARGNRITLLANGQELTTVDNNVFSGGAVGVLAMEGGHAAVGSLSVWELP